MNESTNADSKARLAAAVREFTPRRPVRYAMLWPYKAEIETLRSKKASCRVIRDLLQQANVSVSLDTVARFCREVIEEKPARTQKRGSNVRKTRLASSEPLSEAESENRPKVMPKILDQRAATPAPDTDGPRRRGPRIADPRNV